MKTSSSKRDGPEFLSKKRRRNTMGHNNNADERIFRTLSFRAASAILLVLISSNVIRRSNGFGGPLTIAKRSASCLYFSGRRKRNPSNSGYNNDDNDDNGGSKKNKRKDVEEIFEMLPDEDFSTRTQRKLSRSTPNNNNDNRRNRNSNNNRSFKKGSSNTPSSSLLPPPMNTKARDQKQDGSKMQARDDKLSRGLSSWEDFLGGPTSSSTSTRGEKQFGDRNENDRTYIPPRSTNNRRKGRRPSRPSTNTDNNRMSTSNSNSIGGGNNINNKDMLPSIADLFPSNFSASILSSGEASASKVSDALSDNLPPSPSPTLGGVLPVSDLFYRSAGQNKNDLDDDSDNSQQRDDEELPFSAEQSNDLTSSSNKIKIRRNKANQRNNNASVGRTTTPNYTNPNKPGRKKKLQRRGMEMLVGGVPINADPPQRSVELSYQYDKTGDWKNVITTDSRDFGPMYYGPSVDKLSEEEQGLYCEYFVNSTLKWNVCPKDLRSVLNKVEDKFTEEANTESSVTKGAVDGFESAELDGDLSSNTMKEALRNRMVNSLKETFRKASNTTDDKNKPLSVNSNNAELSGELVFSIGVSIEELEISGGSESAQTILKRVLAKGISTSSQCTGFDVAFPELQLSDLGDGTTTISAAFVLSIENDTSMSFGDVKKECKRINLSLAQAMDDGDMQLAMAAAAKKERSWSEEFRNRIVEEFLFDDDDDDGPLDDDESLSRKNEPNLESTIDSLLNDLQYEVKEFKKGSSSDVPFGMPGSPVYSKDDIFLGGGNDGVFWNYAAGNALQSPYQGKLGLRMVDAVTEKAKQRHPRVIAIGDVHGCIDELQDLLRECDYRPGDLVVFLGDLVSKGPDSFAVVQMAREIGAIGVRGNHDFEVVRWHQAIKSGVDPPVVGSEHFHIANCLTKADMKWMYSLPWYITSPDLGALFVHAGFVSGIRLAKQNPRLMMNMRSILPDGTVTSKFFNNWPWARLWDGPQTVLFGHDADRGLQQYEHAIGLDTGCVYGGRLTACILPEKRLVSVNARREYFKYRRKHYD